MIIAENAELHRAQRSFRKVLDAFARPGVVVQVEMMSSNPTRPAALDAALEAVARLFVDQATTFCVEDVEADTVATYLTSETHATQACLADADFVVVPSRVDAMSAAHAVRGARAGTLLAPEKGATIFLACARIVPVEAGQGARKLATHSPALSLIEVQGPGVKEVNCFAVDRVSWAFARTQRQDEFPLGIEIVLVDAEGRLVAIPRSSRVVCDEAASLSGAACVQEVC